MSELDDTLLGIAEVLLKKVHTKWDKKRLTVKARERLKQLTAVIAMIEVLRVKLK